MLRSIGLRLLVLVLLWFVALLLPWWLALLAALITVWRFRLFYELVLLGWWYDSLYGPLGGLDSTFSTLSITTSFFLLVTILEWIKRSVVIYRRPF
ncbi:MAG: hypothetical protein U9M92_00085 [Patescibacteria group bacterium]|nr:hypothetical protein [Patescibacteria group bacterium]